MHIRNKILRVSFDDTVLRIEGDSLVFGLGFMNGIFCLVRVLKLKCVSVVCAGT